MRVRLLVAGMSLPIVLAFAAVHLHATQRGSEDEQEIVRLIASHAAASQRGDLRGLVDVYHAGAEVRYSDGTMLRGRAEVEKSYRQSLSANPKDLVHSHPSETIRIRFLRPDVAFVDVESVSGGGADQAGRVLPVSRTPLFVVFTKEQGEWGVAVQRSGVPLN